jgi:hypothetical protein
LNRLSIDIDFSPQKVNDLLLKKGGISLFKFAQLFAACAADWHTLPPKYRRTKGKILKRKRSLVALKTSIIKRISDYEEAETFPSWVDRNMSEAEIIKRCWLDPFFNNYFNPRMETTIELEKRYKPQRGRPPINRKSLLAATWGRLKYQCGHKIEWKLIADLYEWFWERLKDYDYYENMKSTEDPVNYFPVQFHRHKNRDMSIYYGRYAKYDDISVFANNGSSVDYRFSYMFFILYNALDKKLRPPISYNDYRELAKHEYPPYDHSETEMDHYYHKVLEHYLEMGVKTEHMPPLIMFPDKSFFSTPR